jgi:hypothetical protein
MPPEKRASTVPPTTPVSNQTLLELIFAIKGIAQSLDFVHGDLERRLADADRDRERDHDRLSERLTKVEQAVAAIPVTTADRVSDVLSDSLRAVVDEARRSMDDVRMKMWLACGQPRGPEASGSGMTVKDGVPVPLDEPDVTGRITLHDDGVRLEGNIDFDKVKKVWGVAKYIIAGAAASTGVAGLIKAIIALVTGQP